MLLELARKWRRARRSADARAALATWLSLALLLLAAGCADHGGRRKHADAAAEVPTDDEVPRTDAGEHDADAPPASPRDGATSPPPEPRDASVPSDAGARGPASDAGARVDGGTAAPADAQVATVPAVDRFGVAMLYPTTPGGREWTLPDDADHASSEWNVEDNPVQRVAQGVFHTVGRDGETRLTVGSPRGRRWWHNVEMTAYFRYTAPHDSYGQERHWELLARGERHANGEVSASSINDGVGAPAGTPSWPGYPFGGRMINASCLGSSYHGNFYLDGTGLFEKEVSHTDGYASQRGERRTDAMGDPMNRWFGLKFVVRNVGAAARVHLELWIDAQADGHWQRVTEADDTRGSWPARSKALDGCDEAPFAYDPAELMTWAGPWITFRSDSMQMDFRWLSAREIDPLPERPN